MKSLKIGMAIMLLLASFLSQAAIKNAVTEQVKIPGACSQCKDGIEAAAFQKNASKASWDVNTKVASITYDPKKTSVDAILKKMALAGYDNQQYLAPDDAFAKLPDCCRTARAGKKEALVAKNAPVHQRETAPASPVETADSDPLKPVLEAYFSVKDALVNSDGKAASSQAAVLVQAIKAVKMGQLSTEQHTVWMKVMKDLSLDAEHIEETKEVSHQRDHFTSLSENMYKLIKTGKPSETVYYQHCPMFNDGKGANWLSKISAVKNPYYGAQMLSCGKTTETIK
ncbi:DUF3347 domain-containing protein [Larkinella sp.]|uniref:DUF3347 domain-containing protein n=1 Tax=Larkinella sp. TaxID=2034517 RepID=UPI003BAA4718